MHNCKLQNTYCNAVALLMLEMFCSAICFVPASPEKYDYPQKQGTDIRAKRWYEVGISLVRKGKLLAGAHA